MRHHNRQLADLRHKGDAGNGQRVEMVRRYLGNGVEAGKGWGKRGRRPVYWPGEERVVGRGVVVGDGGAGVRGRNRVAGVYRGEV